MEPDSRGHKLEAQIEQLRLRLLFIEAAIRNLEIYVGLPEKDRTKKQT